jgi:hypothetical protein
MLQAVEGPISCETAVMLKTTRCAAYRLIHSKLAPTSGNAQPSTLPSQRLAVEA